MVHPDRPTQQVGLRRGDEIISVDGTHVTGKTFEQVVTMIRGELGTIVKLGVQAEAGLREASVTCVAASTLSKAPMGPHGGAAR